MVTFQVAKIYCVSVVAGFFFFLFLYKHAGLQMAHNKDVKARSLNKTATLYTFIAAEIASG